MNTIKVLVADDHDLMRRGIKTIVETKKGWEICAEAQTGVQAVAQAKELKPDIAILDISMPELNGLEAAKRIQKVSEKTEILMLSMHYSDELIREVIEAGIRGYLVKSDSDRDLSIALDNLANHKPFFAPRVTEVILDSSSGRISTRADGPRNRVTSREREIIQLLSQGKSSKEVAALLDISVKTAETHRANIMRKLQIHTVSELVRYALRNRIIEA